MSRLIVGFLCLPFVPLAARAALDPEFDKPYHLRVVVRVADHPLLTPVFRDRVVRELRDSLQAALGDMGVVEVVERDPLWDKASAKGLQQGLEEKPWNEITRRKTHVVLIDFVDGQYEIQARQHDGYTGLSSPVVRRARTWDRLYVARTAALLIDQDFGVVGTVVERLDQRPTAVKVALKGGKLGTGMERWVQKDEVFVIAQVSRRGDRERSTRVDAALLQVTDEPKDGVCRCKVFARYQDPASRLAEGPSVEGYRCLKLGTTQAPVRLRFVDKDKLTPVTASLKVSLSPIDFDPKNVREEHTLQQGGYLQSEKQYRHVAFVRVLVGGNVLANFPVEILDDRTVVCPVSVSPDAVARGQFEHERRRCLTQLTERLQMLSELRKDMQRLVDKQDLDGALKKAHDGLSSVESHIATCKEELSRLSDTLVKLPVRKDDNKPLTGPQEMVKHLEMRRDDLKQSIERLKQALEEKPKQRALTLLYEQGNSHEQLFEIDEAVELYEKALSEGLDDPKFRKKLDKLKKAWAIKDEVHGKARKFIKETWPKLESVAEINDRFNEADAAFQKCRAVGDYWTVGMLLKANIGQLNKLDKELDAVQKLANEDGKKAAEIIISLAEKLKKLTQDANGYFKAVASEGG